jgi:uncharacterized protein (DUF1015 family)
MAEIRPFRGLIYNEKRAGAIEKLVAPPYDVVTRKERDSFVEASPYNIFSLELPDGSECEKGVDIYECSRRLLDRWKQDRVLEFDPNPSLYPYELEFRLPEGDSARKYVRKGVIAAVRIEDWDERVVLPHEKTFDKVTDDRLKLLEATETQFSPIFMLYRHNDAANRIFSFAQKEKLFSTSDAMGNRHTLYRVDDQEVVAGFCAAFSQSPLYIADGHHRYTTALRFRREMEKRQGTVAPDRYAYVMTYLADVEDSGMVVLPTHRILSAGQVDVDACRQAVNSAFEVDVVNTEGMSPVDVVEKLRMMLVDSTGRTAVGCIYEQGNRAELWTVRPGYEEMLHDYNRKSELASLDVVILNDVVFRQLGIDAHALEAGRDIRYEAEAVKAVAGLGAGEVMFMMRSSPAEEVLDVADAGLVMPHKSTFFYPKIMSGLVLNDMRC